MKKLFRVHKYIDRYCLKRALPLIGVPIFNHQRVLFDILAEIFGLLDLHVGVCKEVIIKEQFYIFVCQSSLGIDDSQIEEVELETCLGQNWCLAVFDPVRLHLAFIDNIAFGLGEIGRNRYSFTGLLEGIRTCDY